MPWRPKVTRPSSYRERTYASPYWLVRFPHRRRVAVANDLVSRQDPTVVLDYGAGDGELCATLAGEPGLAAAEIVALEPMVEMRRCISERPEAASSGRIRVVESPSDVDEHTVDVITCMGVLEHLPLADRFEFYGEAQRLLAKDGVVIIDVPVEVGLSVLVKDLGRRVLKGDATDYSWSGLARVVAGQLVFDPARFDPSVTGSFIRRHAGFDYRLLRRELEARFSIEEVTPTPLGWLPPALGNQEVLYTCRIDGSEADSSRSPSAG